MNKGIEFIIIAAVVIFYFWQRNAAIDREHKRVKKGIHDAFAKCYKALDEIDEIPTYKPRRRRPRGGVR